MARSETSQLPRSAAQSAVLVTLVALCACSSKAEHEQGDSGLSESTTWEIEFTDGSVTCEFDERGAEDYITILATTLGPVSRVWVRIDDAETGQMEALSDGYEEPSADIVRDWKYWQDAANFGYDCGTFDGVSVHGTASGEGDSIAEYTFQ